MARIYLPYYPVEILPESRRFYGEVHVSLKVPRFMLLVLATPRDIGFEKVPLGGFLAEPLASPTEYGRLVEELLEEASRGAGGPVFDVGGWKGLIRAMIPGGKKPKPVKLQARLALTYAREILGIKPGCRLRVYPEKLWLPVDIIVSGRTVEAYIVRTGRREKYTVLEKLAKASPEAFKVLKELEGKASSKPL